MHVKYYFNLTGISSSMEDIIGDVVMPKLKKAKLSTACSPMETYKTYLKSKYLEKKMPDDDKWPPSISKKYVNLAVIEKEPLSRTEAEEKSKALTYGDVSKIMRKGNIQLADIATPDEDGVLPKFVLVEGAPGVGKSTFAWIACRKWAEGEILTEYELVILIRLRDESVRKATCLDDLIQYPRDKIIHRSVIEEITKTGGKGVLLLLEGYDELPVSLRKEGSLFRNVIKGDLFDEGTVVVTSRHWASEPFLLPHYNTKRPVSKHIEILGFNDKNIEGYLILASKKDPSLLHDLKQYLELNPHIRSMMYIPLNCAIVLKVYSNSKMKNSPIPTTMTELYSSLLRCLLLRHICDLTEYKDKCPELSDLNNLPECIKSHFDNLAKLAYEGIYKNDQQIIFKQDDMPSDLDTLGLMQSSMELYVDSGTRKSFNFLHLTIQEFLAARHLLTFPSTQHVELLCGYDDVTLSSVLLQFLAGLSPLALESALSTNTCKYDNTSMSMNAIRELFEAKLKLHQKCLSSNMGSLSFQPIHWYMLGSVIANTGCHWDVHITYEYKCFRMFTYGINSCENKPILSKLKLYIEFQRSEADFLEFYNVPITLELLDLCTSRGKISPCENLGSFFDKLSEGSPLTIQHLRLDNFCFTSEASEKIESFLIRSSITTSLTLNDCKFGQMGIVPGMQKIDVIEKLYIHTHTDWVNNHFCNMLEKNKTLKEFSISFYECNFPRELVYSLSSNDSIKRLALRCCEHRWCTCCRDNLCLQQEYAFATIISKNRSVTELSITCWGSHGLHYRIIAQALSENITLEKFKISICFVGFHVEAFCKILSENTTLKEFHLLECNSFSNQLILEIFTMLTDCLTSNKTLSKMLIALPVAFQQRQQSLDYVNNICAKDSRIHCEWFTLHNIID